MFAHDKPFKLGLRRMGNNDSERLHDSVTKLLLVRYKHSNFFQTFSDKEKSFLTLVPCWGSVAGEVEGGRRELVLVQLPVEQILDVNRLSGSGSSDLGKML